MRIYNLFVAIVALALPGGICAEEDTKGQDAAEGEFPEASNPQKGIYTTHEERRDAGLEHEITGWLTLSGLAEVEYLYKGLGLFDTSSKSDVDELVGSIQLVAEVTPWPWVTGQLVYEYDSEVDRHKLEEAMGAITVRDFEIEFGDFYPPFGEYISHFVSGPLIEFGETRGRSIGLTYALSDRFDLSAYAYRGRAKNPESGDGVWDWVLAAEGPLFGRGTFAMSYISDLADSDEGFLGEEGDRYQTRVGALSGNLVVGWGRYELVTEYVHALGSFQELEPDRNQPRAWNLELAYFPEGKFSYALRLEGSKELEGAPKFQSGFSATWLTRDNTHVTVEYLNSTYRRGFAEDGKGREIEKGHQVGGLIVIAF